MKASSDPRHNDKLRSASTITMLANRLTADIEREEDDETMQTAAQLVLELEALLSHYRLDLQEILPAQVCAECKRETTHYRHRGPDLGVRCMACQVLGSPRLVPVSADVRTELVPPSHDHDRASILDAARLATAGREENYGAPSVTFGRIAEFWSVIFGLNVLPHQVALALSALKIARAIETPHHGDNWVDLAGYAACGAEVAGAKRSA